MGHNVASGSIPTVEQLDQMLQGASTKRDGALPKGLSEALSKAFTTFYDPQHDEYNSGKPLLTIIDQWAQHPGMSYRVHKRVFQELRDSIADHVIIEERFVRPKHMAVITEFAQSENCLLSITESGPATLEQLARGALPKPHAILEKTIKEASLQKAYKGRCSEVLEKIRNLAQSCGVDFEGLVGHWQKDAQDNPVALIGIHVDSVDAIKDDKGQNLCKECVAKTATNEHRHNKPQFFLPIDMDILDESVRPLLSPQNSRWHSAVYTGDYDIHDFIVLGGSGGAHPPPADSGEEKRFLKRLNCTMPGLHKGDENETMGLTKHALFQHGPQINYPAHMMDQERGQPVARPLVGMSLPVALCVRGRWLYIKDAQQLKRAYEEVGAILKNTWGDPDALEAFQHRLESISSGPSASAEGPSSPESMHSLRRVSLTSRHRENLLSRPDIPQSSTNPRLQQRERRAFGSTSEDSSNQPRSQSLPPHSDG